LDGEFKPIARFIKLGQFQLIDQSHHSQAHAYTTEAVLEYKEAPFATFGRTFQKEDGNPKNGKIG